MPLRLAFALIGRGNSYHCRNPIRLGHLVNIKNRKEQKDNKMEYTNKGKGCVAAREQDSSPAEEDGILRVEDGALRRPRRVPAALCKTC